jgi:kynurenine formamidase
MDMQIIDLSAPIVPSPPQTPEPLRTEIAYSDHAAGAKAINDLFAVGPDLLRGREGWAVETFTLFGTHNSTHVDAPYHYNSRIQGKPAQTIDQLPLEWFFAPGVVLDFQERDDGQAVDVNDLKRALESVNHRLVERNIVLVRTGRDAFIDDPSYMGRGPGVTPNATRWLYDRGVRVMGIDAWGWDRPLWMQAQEARATGEPGVFWAAHQMDLAYCQLERLANLDRLPATGFTVACFPLRLIGAGAAPARVVAIIE